MLEKYEHLPVYHQAREIMDLTRVLVETINVEADEFNIREQMLSNATVIPGKIAGAEGGELYSIRIENAYLIKIAARELQAQTSLCKHMNLTDPNYLQVLRDELDDFRAVFKDWISSWDRAVDEQDEWSFEHLLH